MFASKLASCASSEATFASNAEVLASTEAVVRVDDAALALQQTLSSLDRNGCLVTRQRELL